MRLSHKGGLTLNHIKHKLYEFTNATSLNRDCIFKINERPMTMKEVIKPSSTIVIKKREKKIKHGNMFSVTVPKTRALGKIKIQIHQSIRKWLGIQTDIENISLQLLFTNLEQQK